MSCTIIHKKDKNGNNIPDEVWVNTKFLILSNFEISKNKFTLCEQRHIENYINAIKTENKNLKRDCLYDGLNEHYNE